MQQLELFDQVTVTWPEVHAWLRQVPGIDPDSPRAGAYVRLWNVPAKIAAAKAGGVREYTAARCKQRPSQVERKPRPARGRRPGNPGDICEL